MQCFKCGSYTVCGRICLYELIYANFNMRIHIYIYILVSYPCIATGHTIREKKNLVDLSNFVFFPSFYSVDLCF